MRDLGHLIAPLCPFLTVWISLTMSWLRALTRGSGELRIAFVGRLAEGEECGRADRALSCCRILEHVQADIASGGELRDKALEQKRTIAACSTA